MLPEQKAYQILETYEGKNNQILYWKHRIDNEEMNLSRSQADYILNYHNTHVLVAKRVMKIDPFLGEKLQEEHQLKQIPESIWVEKLLATSDKAYHVMGRIIDGAKLQFMWIPKCFVIKDRPCNIKIDYKKYSNRPPLSHQKESIEKLVCNNKFILADDMGLGKTTATVIASIETGAKKILIICPATLKINWQREIAMYTKATTFIVDGKDWQDGYQYYIINYDIIKNFHEVEDKKKKKKAEEDEYIFTEEEIEFQKHIEEAGFDLIIIDEAHYISNPKTQRTKLVNDIAEKTKRLWLLTGTPMTSRPINYFNLLKLIDAPIAQNWQLYVKRYCKGFRFKVKGRYIWKTDGASNLEELRDRTKPYVLRRLKTEVLDLPDKIITPIYLELKSKTYEDLMGEYLNWSENEGQDMSLAVHITKLMKMRVLLSLEKIPVTIEIIERLLEQEKKVIVFTNFTESLETIAYHFGKSAVTLDGRMSKTKRQASVDQFQEDPKKKVFVSNLKAGGVGITLTAAEAVVMNDISFVPSDHGQAEDRAYRYGQKNSVSVYYPIFENTFERIIYEMLSRKKNVIDAVMGDVEFDEEFTATLLKQLGELN
jgi:SWI/SNF-related matrix-associated actin-dependent regulator 1 of chromatin subfamily A